jgi:hypothetical protein
MIALSGKRRQSIGLAATEPKSRGIESIDRETIDATEPEETKLGRALGNRRASGILSVILIHFIFIIKVRN